MQNINNNNNTFQMRFAESLKTIKNKPMDIFLWLVINVICGLTPILFLIFISYLIKSNPERPENLIDPYKSIYEGDLFIFVTSLCSAAVGVYWEIKGEHFWNARRISLILIFIIVFFSSAIYSLLKIERIRTILPFDNNSVWWASLIFLVISVFICLNMFVMRISMDSVDDYAKDARKKIDKLTKNANNQTETQSGEKV